MKRPVSGIATESSPRHCITSQTTSAQSDRPAATRRSGGGDDIAGIKKNSPVPITPPSDSIIRWRVFMVRLSCPPCCCVVCI